MAAAGRLGWGQAFALRVFGNPVYALALADAVVGHHQAAEVQGVREESQSGGSKGKSSRKTTVRRAKSRSS